MLFLQIPSHYVVDRLIMYTVFFMYTLFFSACSFSELFKGAVWACCICMPFYLLELIWLNLNVDSLIQLRQLIGLRSVYLLPSFPLLGHHEPSHVSSSYPLFFITFFMVRETRKYKSSSFCFKKWALTFTYTIGILSLFTISGLWVSMIMFSLIVLTLAQLIGFVNKKYRFKSFINRWKVKKIFLLASLLLIILLVLSSGYLLIKYQLITSFQDTSTVTRFYYVMRILSDTLHLNGFGVGIGAFEKEFSSLHMNFTQFYVDHIDPDNIATYLNVEALKNAFYDNDRIPMYSILGNMITEIGLFSLLIIICPVVILFKKLIYFSAHSRKDWLFVNPILFGLSISVALYMQGGLRANPIPLFFICLADAFLLERPIEIHK